MKRLLTTACAALALLAFAPGADAGWNGKDRGHQGRHYDGHKDRYGHPHSVHHKKDKRHAQKPGKKHRGKKLGKKPGKKHDRPDNTPDPTPDPSPSPDVTASVTGGFEQDTDDNTPISGLFGGALSSDPTTAKMVSDFQAGARTFDEIEILRDGNVIQLRPGADLPWTERPVVFR